MADCVNKQLVEWIQKGDNDKVLKLMSDVGRDVIHHTSSDGTPVLNIAILSHNYKVAKVLMDRGADPCLKDSKGRTALHAAAEVDYVAGVIDLLKKSIVNAQDEDGETALHIAVRNTSVEMVKWLVFGGADPRILTKMGKACRALTNKNSIHQILRDSSVCRPPMTFAKLDASKPRYSSEALPFSMKIPPSSSPLSADFVFYSSSHHNLSPNKMGQLKEEEEVWGPVVEYRVLQPIEVELSFPLQDVVETLHELVLRLLASDTGGIREVTLDVKEDVPPDTPTPTKEDVVYVAYADVRVRLDDAGLLLLLHRPVQQAVTLGKGMTTVKAKMDERVELSIPENFDGQITGELQLERSVPVKANPALSRAPQPRSSVFESQTDYVKLSTTAKTEPSGVNLIIELPLPGNFTGGPLSVYVRSTSLESSWSTTEQTEREARRRVVPTDKGDTDVRRYVDRSPSQSSRDSDSNVSESETDDEIEAKRWTKKQTVNVTKNARNLKLPMVTNKTMTVVETKRTVSEEKMTKKIAKQYRIRRYKRALFFVAGRPWVGWRECREVLVVVTSPSHLSKELGRHLTGGYSLLSLSGEFRVPRSIDFRVSVIGDLFVEHGEGEATITFHHVLRMEESENSYTFVLRKRDERTTQGKFLVMRKRKKSQNVPCKEDPLWKYEGELHFDIARVGQDLKIPGWEKEDLAHHFNDCLLLDLAERLPASEAALLGIRLGLSHTQVDNVIHNPSLTSPVFKSFELLRKQRDRSNTAAAFSRRLEESLRAMEWNQQCDWLLKQLGNWPHEQLDKSKQS